VSAPFRIAVAGIQTESSTFTRFVADEREFVVERGAEVLARYPLDEWLPDQDEIELTGLIVANAAATGPVTPEVYDAFEDEMAAGLAALGPLDGVYLDMHGAMTVLGRERAEEHWIRRVRSIVGPGTVISCSFDTHGNLSHEIVELVDLAAFHRHAPHIDNEETRRRALTLLVEVLRRGELPSKAYVRIPALLPGERTSTAVEPGASVFGGLTTAIEKHDLVDAAMSVSFYWADEARNSAAVMTTAWRPEAAAAAAEELAVSFWEARHRFTIVSERYGSWDEALDYALTKPPVPLVVSDSGDNVTAGGSGDLTYALIRTLNDPRIAPSDLTFLFAGIFDPAAVEAAEAAGEGATADIAVGAWLDYRYAPPILRPWHVDRLLHSPVDGSVSGALLRLERISVSVQKTREPFIRPDDSSMPPGILLGLALVPFQGFDVVVVKNGYFFPSQLEDSKSSFMAITPGGTDLDESRLQFRAIQRPMYPFDEIESPDLTATIIPPRGR
jgi:microcystin degradation protein MlrC